MKPNNFFKEGEWHIKKHKNIMLILLTGLVYITVYGNVEFLTGHIFAETSEESSTPEIRKTSNAESNNLESTLVTELEESQAPSQQVERITKEATEVGWVVGTAGDSIEANGNKIYWRNGEAWSYTYNNNFWIARTGQSIEAVLIVNDRFLPGTNDFYWDRGFLWANQAGSVYAKNPTTNTLSRSFNYKNFNIKILQQLLDDGAVEVSYQITNKTSVAQKIGISQKVNILDRTPIRVLNDFKGVNITQSSLALIPDSETMSNWSVGKSGMLDNFGGYNPKTANGVGWESGNMQPGSSADLKENKPMSLGDADVVMKRPGVMVQPDESTTFKQIVKFGRMVPPTVTLDQKSVEMYKNERVEITGTISDSNNHNYRVYLEMNDLDKTLIPIQDFKNIPYEEVQNYQLTLEADQFTTGEHTVSIIGIDEYGTSSIAQKIAITKKEVNGTPLIQKIPIGETIPADITKLFTNVVGNETKLKSVSPIDSATVGFQWADAVLINADLKEESFKIPVTVYDTETTTFSNTDNIVLDIKDDIVFTMAEVNGAVQENRLNELIFQKSEAKAWQAENGEAVTIELVSQNMKSQFGQYEATIKAIRKDTNKVYTRKISLFVTDEPLKDGWEFGSINETISNGEYKIGWNTGTWWYTFNGSQWMYNNSIEANLIINGVFPGGTSDRVGSGFLWKSTVDSIFSKNSGENSIRRTFKYLDRYKIDIDQRLLGNNAVEVTYQVTNLGPDTQKIGLSQHVDTFVGSDSVPVTPINNFKGINLSSGTSSLVIIPDTETMPNWAAAEFRVTPNFLAYDVTNANGVGWETGKQYRNSTGSLLSPPTILKENQPVNLGDSGVSMKNPGVDVASNESTSFKQILKYGVLAAPQITLNQTKTSMYKDEKITIDGTIYDEDNMAYRVYLELDDKDKTLIPLVDYTNIPYNEVQTYQGTIDGKLFSPGVHTVSVIGIDEYGTRSKPKKIELTITELSATPNIQKVKVGEALSNDLKTLFREIKGTNVVLKPFSIDSSAIGFQWVEATLTDGKKDVLKKIPVTVYNAESTVFNDKDTLALDAKNTYFELVDVRKSNEEGTLDELVRQKVEPKALDMADGTEIPIELITNGIKPIFGEYSATFKVTKEDSGESVQKNSKLSVGGELKFKELPEQLDYKTAKLSQKTPYVERAQSDWKIKLENTIGSNWSLFASAVPFEDQAKEKLKSTLILKKNQTQDVVINETNQKIAAGAETYPTVQWAEKAGLLLKVGPDAKIGNYQGEITWLLSDAP
ncbi:hypothetical protein [Carnobacterium maltaromaticum]|uniref:hypothetical protein n=1 Tax=Carnobacterium maltaromaticum TaxID=2751 RepID=UPI00026C8D81|nr:hypothetical protein [Carnobacterium maltaromaticum]